jgi:two-component system, NtrC family, response regulator
MSPRSNALVLIVDDDPSVRASLSLLLKQAGHRSSVAANPDQALERLAAEPTQLVLQDMNFSRKTSGEEGLALLREIRGRHPELPVVLMTAWGSIALAVEGMKAGASDFITKPWTNPQFLQVIDTALGLAASPRPAEGAPPTREELDAVLDFGALVGEDPRLLKILQVVGRVASTDASVLITGESGTGKELIAEAIHRNSHRKDGPFVKVNLGGISAQLFDSEMFGHVKGAFTDARQDRKGRFEVAHGGTIFLDEIGELDPSAQVKLLRVLQDRTYEVLGSSTSRMVDVRVVSATNRNLVDLVSRGAFREDLLYRLNLIVLHLPPLRERRADIPRLASRFLHAVAQVHRRGDLSFSAPALQWLQSFGWPGNVRQLHQSIERAVLMTPVPGPGQAPLVLGVEAFAPGADGEGPSGGRGGADCLPAVGSMTIDEIERAMIVKSLAHHAGNISRVAESLGMSRAALYRRLSRYGIHS